MNIIVKLLAFSIFIWAEFHGNDGRSSRNFSQENQIQRLSQTNQNNTQDNQNKQILSLPKYSTGQRYNKIDQEHLDQIQDQYRQIQLQNQQMQDRINSLESKLSDKDKNNPMRTSTRVPNKDTDSSKTNEQDHEDGLYRKTDSHEGDPEIITTNYCTLNCKEIIFGIFLLIIASTSIAIAAK